MIIKSLHLKNYKIHKELSIDFSKEINLIQGRNETGKSTIIDAIHKAFFLKAKGNTQQHKALVPINTNDTPEIQLVFELDNKEFTIQKVFGGNTNYVNKLTTSQGVVYEEEEADEKLSEILNQDTGISGKTLDTKWGHLFTFQGSASESPEEYSKDCQMDLFQSMNQGDVSSLIISDKDKQVFKSISEKYKAVYTDTGKLKSSSRLSDAQEAFDQVKVEHDEIHERFDELIKDAESFQLAVKELDNLERGHQEAKDSLKESENKKSELSPLLDKKKGLEKQFQTLEEKHNNLTNRLAKFKKNDSQVKEKSEALEKLKRDLAVKEESTKQLLSEIEALQKSIETQGKEIDVVNSRIDIIENQVSIIDRNKELENVNKQLETIDSLKKELGQQQEAKVRIVEVTQKDLNDLSKNIAEYDAQQKALSNIATTLRFSGAENLQMIIDEEEVDVQEEMVVTSKVVLRLAEGGEVEVAPGNRAQLIEMNEEVRSLKNAIQSKLNSFNVKSLEELQELKVQYDKVQNKISEISLQIKNYDEGYWLNQKEEKEQLNIRAQNSINSFEDSEFTSDLSNRNASELQELFEDLRVQKERTVDDKNIKVAQQVAKNNLLIEEQKQEEELKVKVSSLNSEIAGLKGEVRSFLEDFNGVKECEDSLKKISEELSGLNSEITHINDRLTNESLEELDVTIERLSKVIKANEIRREDLLQQKITLENKLDFKGEQDLNDELDRAKAKLEESNRLLNQEENNAEAIKLLYDLFKSEQKRITDQLTSPFIKKVNVYIQLIFGTQTRITLETNDKEMKSFKLVRRNGTIEEYIDFESLSSGAKEQFSSCVRLAIAEVLSAQYGDSLPVFLDESFNNTDPDRMQGVINMLYKASGQKGLQLILLSSNPSDYEGVGANVIDLDRLN